MVGRRRLQLRGRLLRQSDSPLGYGRTRDLGRDAPIFDGSRKRGRTTSRRARSTSIPTRRPRTLAPRIRSNIIPNIVPTSQAGHPKTIIMLTADAFGVLPPISKLSRDQAMYHFLSGYTAKVAGTERGISEPQATFSTCFGAPFMVHHPTVYARLLGQKIDEHEVECWLVNTGWTGGPYGVGHRMSIAHTRAMVNAAIEGRIANEFEQEPFFGLMVPKHVPDVPDQVLDARNAWADRTHMTSRRASLRSSSSRTSSASSGTSHQRLMRLRLGRLLGPNPAFRRTGPRAVTIGEMKNTSLGRKRTCRSARIAARRRRAAGSGTRSARTAAHDDAQSNADPKSVGEAVSVSLNLSGDQQQRIQSLINQYSQAHPEGSPRDRGASRELRHQIMGVLSDDQRNQYHQEMRARREQTRQRQGPDATGSPGPAGYQQGQNRHSISKVRPIRSARPPDSRDPPNSHTSKARLRTSNRPPAISSRRSAAGVVLSDKALRRVTARKRPKGSRCAP